MAKKQKNNEANVALKVAIVSAAATITVAVITGMFELLQRQPSPTTPSPSTVVPAIATATEQLPIRLDVKPVLISPDPWCIGGFLLPTDVNPVTNPELAYKELDARHFFDIPPDKAETVQDFNGAVAEVTVTSLANQEWVRLANKIMVKIANYEPLPGPVDSWVVIGCGGGGNVRDVYISIRNLRSTFSGSLPDPKVDFFTLQPGEFEVFSVSVTANEPGHYELNFGVEYSYQGTTSELWSKQTVTVLNPELVRGWLADRSSDPPKLVHVVNYRFENGEHIEESPPEEGTPP